MYGKRRVHGVSRDPSRMCLLRERWGVLWELRMQKSEEASPSRESEREAILQVLYRDREVQNTEAERIRNLKTRLQHLRWKGAKSVSQEYKEKSCARCQQTLGLLLNRGAVCQGCSHRVCSECRVFLRRTRAWKCTVCFEDRNVKIKTGDWFFEERAKKFPTEGKHETAGAKLLQSYQKLSNKISVVPPTPPPLSESQCGGGPARLQELGQFKGFNKSVENLFLSVTTHMKKLSKSQNDMTSDKQHPEMVPRQREGRPERRSQSDTAINVTTRAGTPDILKPLSPESPRRPMSPVLKQEDISSSPVLNTSFSGGLRQGSLISINSTCTEMGNFDKADVTGEIEFAIRYCLRTHSLEICIRACKNLAFGEERKKKCNPYVKTYLLPDRSSQGKRKTGVQKNTVEPTFQETLKYQVELAQLASQQLQVSVWHLGVLTRRVFLGEVIVPLATWDFEDRESQSFRCCLTLPDQQRLRLKSPVLKKQACPQWKHSFIFKGVTPSQLRQSSLELTVWDQATFGVNDRFLGGARLGLKEDLPGGAHTSSQAKLQWQKVLSSPNLWTDMTLILH
ncbi:hypothetical protein E5288_WYG005661 [Bos mutus]|uniref:Synaptotagmin-like protein 3 n=1 Tax=Bos mutus TaxID=72004 RepID=A0A6B0RXM2_9CETA|nr:hypothetical protein [Bos mutus]